MQLLLLMTGGVLIMFGALRSTFQPGYQAGLDAYWDGKPEKAKELLEKELEEEPDSIPTRVGLVLAYLDLNELDRAEKAWAYVESPPDDGPLTTTRLEQWKNQNARVYQRLQGDISYARAYLTGERVLKAHRCLEPQETIDIFEDYYDRNMAAFRGFIEGLPESYEATAKMWQDRYVELDHQITHGQRDDDVVVALRMMKKRTRDPHDETSDTLNAMLDRHLDRAKREIPSDIRVHTWRLKVLEVLAHRGEELSNGTPAATELESALVAAGELLSGEHVSTNAPDMSRAYFAYALALLEFSRIHEQAKDKYTKAAQDSFYSGQHWFSRVEEEYFFKAELQAMSDKLSAELKRLFGE